MSNNQATLHTPKELLHELKTLVVEAETMMADSLTEHSAEALAKLRTRIAAAQQRFEEVYQVARKKVVAGARYTDTTIRAHPYESLAIAVGVGLLVGVLAGRRSK